MSQSRGKHRFLVLLCLLGALSFTALGAWQIERRSWKMDLIARVGARIHAAPVDLPRHDRWSGLEAREVEYRRVRASGTFLHDRETLVDAVTERGAGFWVVTPLRTTTGIVLVNRGFVPPERKSPTVRPAAQIKGPVTVTGLLRLSEPRGRFLRANRPSEERWYSRDVAAIAKARTLHGVVPFFIDADASLNPGGWPVGGLTVVRFRDMHLVYALTWFGLATLSAWGLILLLRPQQGRD